MWDTLCAPNVSLIQKFHPIAWCVHTQQLNQRLDAIRGHCDSMGYGSEINPPHMNTRDQASRITESANNSLEASGRSLTHTCAHAHTDTIYTAPYESKGCSSDNIHVLYIIGVVIVK